MSEIKFSDICCACSMTDDGIRFCDFHANAEKIVESLRKEVEELKKHIKILEICLNESERVLTPLSTGWGIIEARNARHYRDAIKPIERQRHNQNQNKII